MSTFAASVRWSGTTAHRAYNPDADGSAPGKPVLPLGTGIGDAVRPDRYNPEELFGLALANCHMLTFLALAAKVGVDVRSYDDDVTISLETVDRVTRIGRVRLAPTITLAAGSVEKARDLFDKAHRYCFVANSISCAVDLEPQIQGSPPASGVDPEL